MDKDKATGQGRKHCSSDWDAETNPEVMQKLGND